MKVLIGLKALQEHGRFLQEAATDWSFICYEHEAVNASCHLTKDSYSNLYLYDYCQGGKKVHTPYGSATLAPLAALKVIGVAGTLNTQYLDDVKLDDFFTVLLYQRILENREKARINKKT